MRGAVLTRMPRIFLLSPAHAGGKRAALLTRPGAAFALARRVQIGAATLGEVFAFCSGLYFRGKLTYARRFADPSAGMHGIEIITPSRGLLPPDILIDARDLAEFAQVPVDAKEPKFTAPLATTAQTLAALHPSEVVLLGSVATRKYLDVLQPIFGTRLRYPLAFAGRGDMSRGAMLLRSVSEEKELVYGSTPILPPQKRPDPRREGKAPPTGSPS